MKRLLLLLPLLLLAHHASAYQVLGTNSNAQLGASMVAGMWGADSNIVSDNLGTVPPSAVAGTFSHMCFNLVNAPGVGTSRIWALRVNQATSTLQVIISDTATTGCDDIDRVHIAVGDTINWREIVNVGAPAASFSGGGITFTPDNPGEIALWSSSAPSGTSQAFFTTSDARGSPASTVEASSTQIMPENGVFDRLEFTTPAAPAGANTYDGMFRQNFASTTLTATITKAGNTASDLTHNVTVSAGDILDFAFVPNGAASSINARSFRYHSFENTTSVFFASSMGATQDSPTGNRFMPLGNRSINTGENIASQFPIPTGSPIWFTSIYASTTAPGGAASRTFVLRINGVSTGVSCTMTGTQDHCFANGFLVQASPGDLVTFMDSPSGSPATGNPMVSATATNIPTFQINNGPFRILRGTVRIYPY